jgi:hypothetical protein
VDALRTEFQATRERSAQRLADALAPYSRFVRAEHGRWDEVRSTLAGWRERATRLLADVDQIQ